MSPLGGDWVDCNVDTQRGVNRCVVYDYETGSVTFQGDYVVSDTRRQSDVDDLTLVGFDDTHIYMADGHVLEPLDDPLQGAKDQGIRCERRQYVAPVGSLRNKYCFRLQEWLVEASLLGNLEQIRKALAAGAHPEGTC